MNPHQEITFHLSKDEIQVYGLLCREMDVPPDKYRTGQKVECPLFHAVDISVAFCLGGASWVDPEKDDHLDDVVTWAENGKGIIRKTAQAANEVGARDDLRTMVEEDPRVAPDGEYLTEEEEKMAEMFWESHDM